MHKCSKAYASEFLASYHGHHMAVYAVRWNYLHNTMFLSASADWSVKLWDCSKDVGAVMTFDMNNSVGDVAWAPYSSTVFAVRSLLPLSGPLRSCPSPVAPAPAILCSRSVLCWLHHDGVAPPAEEAVGGADR